MDEFEKIRKVVKEKVLGFLREFYAKIKDRYNEKARQRYIEEDD